MRTWGGGSSKWRNSPSSQCCKSSVLSCCLASRAQIHCSLSLASNNWTPENRVSNLSAQSWLLGPWPSVFTTRETWQKQKGLHKTVRFRSSKKSWQRGGWYVYRKLSDALIGLNLITWHSAQLRGLQPSIMLFESTVCLATRLQNNTE